MISPDNRSSQAEAISVELRRLSADKRALALGAACGGDAALMAEVERALKELECASPTGAVTRTVTAAPAVSEDIGAQIGPYRLLQRVGEGGFGIVFQAEQSKPVRRQVALKIIKLGMDTRQVVARFEQERQALALMDHPNIAKVLDAGATASGRPYFVMELVKGVPITEYADLHKLGVRQRLELFITVCHALQHAHQKGLIHRDIKPSNVMVMLQDGKPVPKIIDFGIAKATAGKLTELTLHTEQSQMIGTPEYMSPEQADLSGLDVDTRSDIYSLGVVLYELLTGTVPFDSKTLRSAGYAEIQRIIREQDAPRLSARLSTLGARLAEVARARGCDAAALGRLVKGELDWIAMRCLEKDRTRRYETANELALDLERYLHHEPIAARPPSAGYRLRKFVRRNRSAVAFTASVVLLLLGGIVATSVAYLGARRERENARRINTFYEQIFGVANPYDMSTRALTPIVDSKVDDLLVTAAGRIGDTFADRPELEVQVRRTIGQALFGLDRIDEGVAELRRSVELARRALAPGDMNRLLSMRMLGARLFDRDENLDLHESAELLSRVLEEALSCYEENEPIVVDLRMILAWALLGAGDSRPARAVVDAAFQHGREVLDRDPHLHVALLAVSGACFRKLGQLDAALAETSRSTLLAHERLDPFDANTPQALREHATVLLMLGKTEAAIAAGRQSVDAVRRVFGDSQKHTVGHETLLILDYLAAGLPEEAEAYARERIEYYQRAVGEGHRGTIMSRLSLADALRMQGKSAEALPLAEQCLADVARLQRSTTYEQAHAVATYADILVRLDRWEDAEGLLTKCIDRLESAHASDYRALFPAMSAVLGGIYVVRTRHLDEAALLLLAGFEWFTQANGIEHAHTQQLLSALVKVYEATGKSEEAIRWRRRLSGEPAPPSEPKE
ncbi:MAG: protein kinase domain-containing protein [Planctomycetota bacterium]